LYRISCGFRRRIFRGDILQATVLAVKRRFAFS
jgi:hypothetical protein